MSDKCPRQIVQCSEVTVATGEEEQQEDWSVCLPFGASLQSVNGVVSYTPGNPPEDGVYGLVTIADGCIAAMEAVELPKYQGVVCAPVPCPCDSDSDSGSSNVCNPSSTTGNLYSCDAAGQPLVLCNISSSDTVTVTGNGTSSSPFVLSVSSDSSGETLYTNTGAVLSVTKSGGIWYIDHATGYSGNTTSINGMVFDSYGHLTAYNETTSSGVTGVIGQNGVTATTDNQSGVVTVELETPAEDLSGDYYFGGQVVTLDSYNRIHAITQGISLTASSTVWGTQQVSYNSLGSITGLTELNDTGTCIHARLAAADSGVVQRRVTVNLLHETALLVEVVTTAAASWGSGLSIYIDDTKGTTMVFNGVNGSITATATTGTVSVSQPNGVVMVRAAFTGIWEAGEHYVYMTHSSGFPSAVMSVSVLPIQVVTEVYDQVVITVE